MQTSPDYLWSTPPIPSCPYLDNCSAVDGCASCSLVQGPFDSEGDPVGLIAASAISPATSEPAVRVSRQTP